MMDSPRGLFPPPLSPPFPMSRFDGRGRRG